jgi:GNAT superfamily N-acetyltransferase
VPTIRPARFDELVSIGRLTVAAYEPVLTFGDADPYRETLADAAGRAAGAELWVAEHDGDIVGTVTLCRPGTTYAEIAQPGELEVRMLAVAPDAQGTGVGGRLMAGVHETASADGFLAVVLSVVETTAQYSLSV